MPLTFNLLVVLLLPLLVDPPQPVELCLNQWCIWEHDGRHHQKAPLGSHRRALHTIWVLDQQVLQDLLRLLEVPELTLRFRLAVQRLVVLRVNRYRLRRGISPARYA